MTQKIDISTAKVLVIDDEPEITDIVETYLGESGYRVLVENNGLKAVETARNFKPDVILLDIMMPDCDGYDICEALKKDSDFADIPVIFLTGKDRADDMGRSFKAGGDMFIKKPFSCERLMEILGIVLLSTGRS